MFSVRNVSIHLRQIVDVLVYIWLGRDVLCTYVHLNRGFVYLRTFESWFGVHLCAFDCKEMVMFNVLKCTFDTIVW